MDCKRGWTTDFIADNFPLNFRNDTLRKHRRVILHDREKSMLPAMQPFVQWKREIAELGPTDCFIDGRAFATPAELAAHLRAIGDDEYRAYQERIRAFLGSDRAKPFSQDHFADVIVRTILADLGR